MCDRPKQKNLTSAVAALQEALTAAHQLKRKYEVATTLSWWGEVEKRIGNHIRSIQFFWAAKNVYDSIGAWQAKDEREFESDRAPRRAG